MKRSNWEVLFLRLCFLALLGALSAVSKPFGLPAWIALWVGVVAAGLAIALGVRLRRASLAALLGGSVGAVFGAVMGLLFAYLLGQSALMNGQTLQFVRTSVPFLGAYSGMLVGIAKSELIDLSFLGVSGDRPLSLALKLLDTSVLIDGRIADIAESGFMEGKLIIPQFVLNELQFVADSADSAKRNRGRRGLDVVQRLQKMAGIDLVISTQDFGAMREVDLKLIEAAKLLRAKIVTNDFNLNKLAQVQGVSVLNINELANCLKPVVLPGEMMRVFILKEGKEYNQGVAYLDDGTMVVVDNARRLISKTVDITVTSVLQTTAGKMIFGKYDERMHVSGAEHRGAATSASSAAI